MNLSSAIEKKLIYALGQAYTSPQKLDVLLSSIERRVVDFTPANATHPEILACLVRKSASDRWLDKLLQAALKGRPVDAELAQVANAALQEFQAWCSRAPDPLSEVEIERTVDFVVHEYHDPQEVEKVLKNLDYSQQGRWLDGGNFREKVRRLIEDAYGDGWDRLLAFCVFADRWTRRGVPTRARAVLRQHEMDGVQLFIELNQGVSSPEEIVDCYHKALDSLTHRPSSPPRSKETVCYVAYAVAAAQDAAASGPADLRGKGPLARFQGLLAAPRRSPPAEAERFVFVELQESMDATISKPQWNCKAWLYEQRGDDKSCERLEGERDKYEEATLDPGAMPAYLEHLRRLLAKRRIGPDGVPFEFFMSRTRLPHAIDQWPVRYMGLGELTFGSVNPVVLRIVDRVEEIYKDELRQNLEQCWQRFSTARTLRDACVVPHPRGGDFVHIFGMLTQPRAGGVRLQTHVPPDDHPEREFPCIKVAFAVGLPVVLWARQEAAASALETQLDAWANCEPQSLPQLVHELRQAAKHDLHLGRHVSLVYENAEHRLPENVQAGEAR